MLIGGLVMHQLTSSSVVGVGSLIDGSQNAVWPFENEFRRITRNAVTLMQVAGFYVSNSCSHLVPIPSVRRKDLSFI